MEETTEIRLSPSSIITWLRCPREFYYNYVERLPTPLNKHLIKGNIVHKVLELFYKRYVKDLKNHIIALLNKEWNNKKEEWDSLDMTEKELITEKADCKKMLDLHYLLLELKIEGLIISGKVENQQHAFHLLKPKFKELWLEDKELNLCGLIDRLHTDWNGDITIGDYKTSSKFGIGIKDEYEIQCSIYALLLKRCKNILANYTSIIFLRYGEEVRTRVTPDQIKMALDTVKLIGEKTKTKDIKDYPMNQGKFCKYCSRFGLCSGIKDLEDDKRRDKALKEFLKKKKTTSTPVKK